MGEEQVIAHPLPLSTVNTWPAGPGNQTGERRMKRRMQHLIFFTGNAGGNNFSLFSKNIARIANAVPVTLYSKVTK